MLTPAVADRRFRGTGRRASVRVGSGRWFPVWSAGGSLIACAVQLNITRSWRRGVGWTDDDLRPSHTSIARQVPVSAGIRVRAAPAAVVDL
jgi:hypothetical protein